MDLGAELANGINGSTWHSLRAEDDSAIVAEAEPLTSAFSIVVNGLRKCCSAGIILSTSLSSDVFIVCVAVVL